MSNFYELYQQMGASMSPEQLQNMKEMGEKFYESIDMDKYKPKEATKENLHEFLSLMTTEEQLMSMKYKELVSALNSGLSEEELTEKEQEILSYFKN